MQNAGENLTDWEVRLGLMGSSLIGYLAFGSDWFELFLWPLGLVRLDARFVDWRRRPRRTSCRTGS